jgi:hypothetical protein
MLMGGGSMLNDKPVSTVHHKNEMFFRQKPNGDGRFPLRRTSLTLMPSWDDADALFTFGKSIALVARERVLKVLEESEGMEIKRMRPWLLRLAPVTATPLHRWHVDLDRFEAPLAVALTANAALVVIHKDNRGKSPDEHRLVAYERSDGKPLWQVSLPSRPVLDGLAVAHDGTVILTCRNGGILCLGEKK